MKNASVFIIGTELTCGIIADSHIQFITQNLTELGINVIRAEILPDDGNVCSNIKYSTADSDIIIVTGGLGPTSDDNTRSDIASLAGTTLCLDKNAFAHLKETLHERAEGANKKQAMIPQGFETMENPNGTAPGFCGTGKNTDGKEFFIACLPGPPKEMRPMFCNILLPKLLKLCKTNIKQKDEYSVFLIAEAKLEELCSECKTDNIKWGTRFQDRKISLYVSGPEEERIQFIEKLKKKAGPGLIADGNKDAIQMLASFIAENRIQLNISEQFTGGLLSAWLTEYENCAPFIRSTVSPDIATIMKGNNCTALAFNKENNNECVMKFCKDGKEEQISFSVFNHSRQSLRRRFCIAAAVLTEYFLQDKDIKKTVANWKNC